MDYNFSHSFSGVRLFFLDIGNNCFKCKLCEKVIKSTKRMGHSGLKQHYDIVHTVGNEIICPKCGHIAKNNYALKVHKYRKHKK